MYCITDDNVCRGHAARGSLAGKVACEWWAGRAVAPISGVFFLLFLHFITSTGIITDCYNDTRWLHPIIVLHA